MHTSNLLVRGIDIGDILTAGTTRFSGEGWRRMSIPQIHKPI
jgi:hypothetical protein